MTSSVKGALFDKDGTLFDFASTWEAWALAFLNRMGRDEVHAAELAGLIGFDYSEQKFLNDSIVIAGTSGEVAKALTRGLEGWSAEAIEDVLNMEAANAPQAEAVPLKPLLNRLKAAGLKLGVATNDAEMPALAHLKSADVTGYFDFIAGFDSGYGGKPAPAQMQGFCKAVGLAPNEVIMVGDSLHDLHAGKAAGMRCVGVLTGLAGEAELSPFAEVVLPDIGHIPAWLGLK
ncbi:HAD family hydrolase [Lentibacter algarum]|uniref:HAD family hydrolase n=1 Tax=Lentibacter algarum TaxID=576131 RepID=UPI001C082A2A|nr:HAD family hydrolase [Lentibacter algarum]MBU2982916.1 HAD family hydrolase [Lentibacter algarum]